MLRKCLRDSRRVCLQQKKQRNIVLAIPLCQPSRSCSSVPDAKTKANKVAVDNKKGYSVTKSIVAASTGAFQLLKSGIWAFTDFSYEILRNPKSIPGKLQGAYDLTKETIHHYWVGSKLLWEELKLTSQILNRLLKGHDMTRRERMQLMRTTTDMFRLVPFMVFVIVPFMELLLPLALKLFPNMLPSTFQDKLKREEYMKQDLQMRLAVAGFLQETLHAMVAKNKTFQDTSDASSAREVLEFMEKARKGQPLSLDSVLRISRLFKDELTLANIARPQLVMMCQFMRLPPYGNDAFLRFQLRAKMRMVKEDDRRILWEGVSSLSKLELREACRDRGMRSVGLTTAGYKQQLNEWLELSIQKNVPISLLVISRAFALSTMPQETMLRDSLSSLDDGLVNEVVLAAARDEEQGTAEIRTRKLESLQFQKELIKDEFEDQVEETVGAAAAAAAPQTAPADGKSHSSEVSSADARLSVEDGGGKQETTAAASKLDRLTLAEVKALGELALTSSVELERAELALLKNRGKAVKDSGAKGSAALPTDHDKSSASHDSDAVSVVDGPGVVATTHEFLVASDAVSEQTVAARQTVAAADNDAGAANLQRALDRMLGKLEIRIATTEKALENLPRLDLDGDGVVDAEELRQAVLRVLKGHSNEKAEELIRLLDKDKDGQVSVAEILELVRVHTEANQN